MEPWVIVASRLRLARLWAAEEIVLAADELKGVLLPYPSELERHVKGFVKGLTTWDDLVSAVRDSGLPYVDAWAWTEEPLLRRLRSLHASGFKLSIECYGPPIAVEAEASWELARQILRVRVTGKVDLEAWRKLVGKREPPAKAGYATISLQPIEIARVTAWEYPPPPTDSLSSRNLSEEQVMRMVNYIFNFVVTSRNPDEAYIRWLEELKYESSKINKLKSIALMLNIIEDRQQQETS
ncbi:MAG: hypothetical protein NZ954_02125 [Thermofilaceae archaeon]|nr:hypothetical protein [Thermofilaceae archaeon]MDW8003470.1 hypothetical protein [Thermofilaceae archaeon]